ncbi:uncharacterized protein LY89DRAFT_274530 [Mollisia scopiformis]|uniref:DUF1275 domain protein n=1 Tax=Mollisia scopiformis TaxID=149040 RepID=A0A132BB73_MOLSC|nr:uncharacterized protein LY89DRAFT_274530 [Mollisia scopiformis]KUJ09628.1 hypothetical protein LY89DRAFT_274530 [Mollisia scopiformis]
MADQLSLPTPSSTESALPPPRNRLTRLRSFLNAPVKDDLLLECQLLVLSFGIGIQDATSFPDYHCFASNQTGNTVLFAVGVARLSTIFSISNIGVSLSLFILGVSLAGQLGNHIGPRKRWWLLLSSILQTIMVFGASTVQYTGPSPVPDQGPQALAVLSLLAFSSGAQVAMARGLKITEITTAMATAAYVDIFVDKKIFQRKNRQRNRRIAFLITLFAGSFAGAFMYKARGSAFALLVSAIGKLAVVASLVWNEEMPEEEVEKVALQMERSREVGRIASLFGA